MKKKGVILLVVLLLLAVPVFAQNSGNRNIWNGLHTGMTEEQALTRAREIVGNFSFTFSRHNATGISEGFVKIDELGYTFSQGLTKIVVFSDNPVYGFRAPGGLIFNNAIEFKLYNGNLVAVGVYWRASNETRNQMLRQQFGRPKYDDNLYPAWEVSGLFVATVTTGNSFQVLFVDISSFRNAVRDDTRRKQQSSGIQF